MVNAYTTTAAGADNSIAQYYSKVFLERLVAGPIMLNYVKLIDMPLNSGKVAYFPRMVNSSTTVSAYKLAEGTVISTEAVDDAKVSATIEQFGNAKALFDLVQLAAISSIDEETVKEQADQAGNIVDERILQAAYGSSCGDSATAVPTGLGFSILPITSETVSAFQTYAGTGAHAVTAAALRKWVKKLKSLNVKPNDDGFYSFICHSDTAMQLQADSTWQSAYVYTDPDNLRKGVAGTYGGAKIQVDNNVFTSANGSASSVIYYSLLLGRGALGGLRLDGGIKTYVKTSGPQDTSNPINQFATFGWKVNFVAKILNVSSGLICPSCDA
jgi:N4-gp56 family major capsid protein